MRKWHEIRKSFKMRRFWSWFILRRLWGSRVWQIFRDCQLTDVWELYSRIEHKNIHGVSLFGERASIMLCGLCSGPPQYAPPLQVVTWTAIRGGLVTLTFDLVTSKRDHGSPVSVTSLLPFIGLLCPSILDLGSGARQRDRQTTAISALCHRHMWAGHNKESSRTYMMLFTSHRSRDSCLMAVIRIVNVVGWQLSHSRRDGLRILEFGKRVRPRDLDRR